jgi:protein TonB
MIRHSSSFFISIVIHVALLIAVLITWKNYYSSSKKEPVCKCETRMCVNLSAIKHKEIQKPKPQPKKKIEKKPPKKKPKKKVIKKTKPKKVVKKEKQVVATQEKLVPVAQEIPEPKVVPKESEEVVEVTQEKTEVMEVEEVAVKQEPQKTQAQLEEENRTRLQNLAKEYVKLNTKRISELLSENLYYPRSARKRGITGKVTVKFTLKIDASVSNVTVVESKSDILSRAAVKTINNLSGLFPKPQEEITLHVPISYTLR